MPSSPLTSSPLSLVVAIDGPAAAGKSSVARAVARRLGLTFLDTGAMYRAVTLACLERGVAPYDGPGCSAVAASLQLSFDDEGELLIGERKAEPAIRTAAVDAQVSEVSAHAGVRACIVATQRRIASERGNLVAEGRDTTTVVFPEATHKFFLVASSAERARRRAVQRGDLERVDDVRAELDRRDAYDRGREHSPLVQAADAIVIDTEGRDEEGVVELVLAAIHSSIPAAHDEGRDDPRPRKGARR